MGTENFINQSAQYQIRVKGLLDTRWASWFDGFTLEHKAAETALTGVVPDQAALHGILTRIRDLGLTLLCVKQLEKNHLETPER